MSTYRDRTHVSAERMQAFLDRTLGAEEALTVEEHASSCARCRSELEAWSTLYRELGTLQELAPSAGFAGRVLEAIPEPAPERLPVAARIRSWLGLGRRAGPVTVDGHVDARAIQELLDGILAPARAAAVEAHLGGCRLCREEADGWRTLMVGLEALPRLEPSPVLAERVMAHVRVQRVVAIARPGLRERLTNWLTLNPGSRRRLAALAGAAVTPAVTVALVTWTVFSHPLVTPGSLVSFLWLKTQGLMSSAAGAMSAQLAESATAFQLYSLIEPFTQSAEAAAAGLTLLGGLTMAAVWVLYRNVFVASTAEPGYARLPF